MQVGNFLTEISITIFKQLVVNHKKKKYVLNYAVRDNSQKIK